MTKILVWGIGGKMGGKVVECLADSPNAVCVGGYDKFAQGTRFSLPVFNNVSDINVDFDAIIDFSRPDAIDDFLDLAVARNTPVVITTTGHSQEQLDKIHEYSNKIPVFMSSNMSLGINLLIDLCKKAADMLGDKFDIELIEQHHNLKVDSPSGTALTIAKEINSRFDNQKEFTYGRHDKNFRREKKEIGIHAVRGGTVVGKHSVLFMGNDEVITISHEAQSKTVFVEGAIKAALFMQGKPARMYSMSDIIAEL